MEKLELKHLAPYLAYGLKYWSAKKVGLGMLGEDSLESFDNEMQVISMTAILRHSEQYKPILRPLSDLTKEIEHLGEKFVPFIELAKIELGEAGDNEFSDNIIENDYFLEIELLPSWFSLFFNKNKATFSRWDDGEGMSSCSNDLLFKLFEHHFDVFGLIEKGLAIDINKIKEGNFDKLSNTF